MRHRPEPVRPAYELGVTLAVAAVFSVGPALAEPPAQRSNSGVVEGPAEAGGVEVILKSVEPGVLRGRLVSLTSAAGATLLTDGEAPTPLRVPMTDLVRITSVGTGHDVALALTAEAMGRASVEGDDVRLSLAGGDVLFGSIVGGRAEALLLKTEAFGPLPVPLEAIAKLDTSRAALPTFAEAVGWLDRSLLVAGDGVARGADDRILLTNADVLRGFITLVDPEGITVDNGEGEIHVPHRLVVAVRFAGLSGAGEGGSRAVVTCPASGRMTLRDLAWSGWTVQGRWLEDVAVELDAQHIARVDFEGGRWEWLPPPGAYRWEQVPMLSVAWKPRTDRNVLGGPIVVCGERFGRGIGVHSRSRLTFELAGDYQQFVTLFGLDDTSGPLADVDVSIRVDGDTRHTEEGVRRGRLYGPVRLDVTGAERLELLVGFGQNGDLQDRFNWVEPALIR